MRVKRVLAGIDFSERSLAVARWAAAHFAPDAEIALLHVIPMPDAPHFLRGHLPDVRDAVGCAAPALYGGLRGLAGTLGCERVTVDMRIGDPARFLAEAADEAGAHLICVGTGRRRRGTTKSGGGTVDRLVRRARVPVLAASRLPAGPPARILAAVADDASAGRVVRGGWQLAMAFEATLEVLHVLDAALAGYTLGAPDATDGACRCAIADERAMLSLTEAWLRGLLADAGAREGRASAAAAFGDAGQEIAGRARRSGADLIVLGPAGTTAGDAGGGSGSVSRLVRWAAPCPVLVLAPETPRLEGRGGRDRRLNPARSGSLAPR